MKFQRHLVFVGNNKLQEHFPLNALKLVHKTCRPLSGALYYKCEFLNMLHCRQFWCPEAVFLVMFDPSMNEL